MLKVFKKKQQDDVKGEALYSAPILDSLEDEYAFKMNGENLNYYAKMMNLPGGFSTKLDPYLQKKYKEDKDVREYLLEFGIPQSSSYNINELKHINRYKG